MILVWSRDFGEAESNMRGTKKEDFLVYGDSKNVGVEGPTKITLS